MVKPTIQFSPTHTPGPSSSKRRKEEDEDSNGLASKKQRIRVSFSCGECHRRKQKCDRQIPCFHCVARKVPELCKAYTPGKTDQDINARLSRLEHIIETALPQYCSGTTITPSSFDASQHSARQRSASMDPDDDNRSQADEQDPSGGTFQSGKWYGNSASGSVAPASVLEQLQHVVPSGTIEAEEPGQIQMKNLQSPSLYPFSQSSIIDQFPRSSGAMPSIESGRQDTEQSEAWKSLVQECGVSPHKISELVQELPPRRFSDVLLDYYFASINWTRYPVSERDFRAAYLSICANGVGVNPAGVRFLPLLFVVLSIAVRLAPEHIGGDARTRRVTSLRYYWSSRRSLLIAAAIQPDSLDVVLTRLLSARFLTFDRRITECWSQLGAAVRTAQALGLHRDGSTMGMNPAQVEYRRRIWSYLYHADRSYALVLGRPTAIQDDYTSTLPPSNIDDELTAGHIARSPSLSNPTPMTFVILRHALASIIGRMVHHFQLVRTPSHYSEVLTLDDDLLKFIDRLPPHYSLKPDTSLDEEAKYIPVHRYLLITEILFVRIGLHRPYILRRLSSDRYIRSRQACFDSAIKDFEVRKAFRDSAPKEVRGPLSNAYREFQTAMISGIYLVLDPKGKDAGAMHAILDAFMEDHEGVREMDETTRRELKIIEFLKIRASQVNGRKDGIRPGISTSKHSDSTSNGSDHPADAQLLLGLQQSSLTRPSSRPAFPTLVTRDNVSTPSSSPRTPSMTYNPALHLAHSPTFHRLQQNSHSPAGSGSPTADDESTAQSLLDHWCSTVSNGPNIEGSMTAGMPWGGSDVAGWPSAPPLLFGNDAQLPTGLDTSDWNYWEALVNQIHRVP